MRRQTFSLSLSLSLSLCIKSLGEDNDTVMEDGDNSIVELERLQTVGINMGLLFSIVFFVF
jgi:hypothetical protein